MIDITVIAEALVALVVALMTAVVIPWIRTRTTKEQRELMLTAAGVAVRSAEMIFSGDGRGAEKKEYALKLLKEQGFKVDSAEVEAAVEAAVLGVKLKLVE